MRRELRFVPNSSKTTEGCTSALTSPIYVRWCSVSYLHKHVRLDWTTTHCCCILDNIGMKLFSQKTSEMAQHCFDDRSWSGRTSITSSTLNMHCIRNVITVFAPLRAPVPMSAPYHFSRQKTIISAPSPYATQEQSLT